MKQLSHISAKASHYNEEAKHYDAFNAENFNKRTNPVIANILKKYQVTSILDLTCGTGAQVFYLAKQGYEVVGSDINAKMLKVAKAKVKEAKSNIKLLKGDMRNIKVGNFDAVITIFNAIGHLTKTDFEKTMRNVYDNLSDGGIYLFDIYNLSYLLKDNNITKLTIDWQKNKANIKARVIQYSTINKAGILASYTIAHEQHDNNKLKISTSAQTLQVYTVKQLKDMLQRNGFKILGKRGIDGSRFTEYKTEQMFIIARKK